VQREIEAALQQQLAAGAFVTDGVVDARVDLAQAERVLADDRRSQRLQLFDALGPVVQRQRHQLAVADEAIVGCHPHDGVLHGVDDAVRNQELFARLVTQINRERLDAHDFHEVNAFFSRWTIGTSECRA